MIVLLQLEVGPERRRMRAANEVQVGQEKNLCMQVYRKRML